MTEVYTGNLSRRERITNTLALIAVSGGLFAAIYFGVNKLNKMTREQMARKSEAVKVMMELEERADKDENGMLDLEEKLRLLKALHFPVMSTENFRIEMGYSDINKTVKVQALADGQSSGKVLIGTGSAYSSVLASREFNVDYLKGTLR